MKILIMQLARFGDIYQTWPVINSLKRNHPGVEIHFLCRSTFSAAAQPLFTINQIWKLDVTACISDLLNEKDPFENLGPFLEKIKTQNYDRIINLSFSPLSSYLTNYLKNEDTQISGYDRHQDGYLSIPDDPSALFYAQVGVQKYNRIHITRLFSAVAEVDLAEEDWLVEDDLLAVGALKFPDLPKNYIAIHIGGSSENKRLSAGQWQAFIDGFFKLNTKSKLVFLGTEKDRVNLGEFNISGFNNVVDLVGKTDLSDLFYILKNSKLLVAPDSSLVHIASLLNKTCLNFSFACVNFWETGPLAKGSYVFWVSEPQKIQIEKLLSMVSDLINNKKELPAPYIKVVETAQAASYQVSGYEANDFQWQLLKAIYLGENFPILDDIKVYTAFKQLAELTDMVLRDLEMIRQGQFQNISLEIVNNVEQLILTLEKMIPEIRPLIWWFNTERLRIGPGPDQEVFDRNYHVFNQLRSILAIYVGTNTLSPQLEEGL